MQGNFDELKDPDIASAYLAKKLSEGTLTIFLGAGASRNFGLPNWLGLVNKLRMKVNLADLTASANADELQLGADEVKQKLGSDSKLIDAIEEILYADSAAISVIKAIENKLLIAMSALLMGSARGRVRRVVSLNYDDMLEWFLSLYGFKVKTVHSLPSLEGNEDVTIFHPHGFVPRKGSNIQRSSIVILGMKEANKRLGTPGDAWFERIRHILETGVCLFVGMSGNTLNDRSLGPLFTSCGEKCEADRPLGIWILKGELEPLLNVSFQNCSIVPLHADNEEDIVTFLMAICQKAAIYH